MFAHLFALITALVLFGCGSSRQPSYEIGITPSSYPFNPEEREPSILGFSTELLILTAETEKINLSLLKASIGELFDGLDKHKYQAVLSSLYPYNFNEQSYDFSDVYLATGPVLVVSASSSVESLDDLKGKEIGLLNDSPADVLVEKDPTVLIRLYDNPPTLLNALTAGEIDGALLPILTVEGYAQDLYQGQVRIVTEPLTDEGLRLVTLKGQSPVLIKAFNHTLQKIEANGDYADLLKKWQLGNTQSSNN